MSPDNRGLTECMYVYMYVCITEHVHPRDKSNGLYPGIVTSCLFYICFI